MHEEQKPGLDPDTIIDRVAEELAALRQEHEQRRPRPRATALLREAARQAATGRGSASRPRGCAMTAAFDLDEPYVATDPGDRDEHLVRPLRWRWLERVSTVRQAARLCVGLGLHPIAVHGVRPDGSCTCERPDCAQPGKHPIAKGWQTAALDLDSLDRTLARDPDLNVGLRTGRQPDGRFLIVVDVDGPRSLLEPLESGHGAFPETLTARTGRGGLHLYYFSETEMGNRAGVVDHVDVRGRGGQVVAAPSLHRSGDRYTWLEIREPAVLS